MADHNHLQATIAGLQNEILTLKNKADTQIIPVVPTAAVLDAKLITIERQYLADLQTKIANQSKEILVMKKA